VNNAAYWHAVEQLLQRGSGPDTRSPLRARLDHRHPIDLDDDVELVEASGHGRLAVSFVVGGTAKAVALVQATS
jgi:acyl-ACP thioesterase